MSTEDETIRQPDPLAEALRKLAPLPPEFSRDRLLFDAGKSAAGSRIPAWLWPSATGFFAAVSLVLAGFLVSPTTATPEPPQVVYRPVDTRTAGSDPGVGPRLDSPGNESDSTDRVAVTKAPEHAVTPVSSWDSADLRIALKVRRDVFRWGVESLPVSVPQGTGRSNDVARDVSRFLYLPPGVLAIDRRPSLPPVKKATNPLDIDD